MAVNFDKISLTAKMTAYMRQYSDIPFAKDVALHLRAREALEKLLQDSQMSPDDIIWYAPLFEVRYKSIAQMIRKSQPRQIIELASGISLRGLAMTQDQDITYVESDLEELTSEKISLVDSICQQDKLITRDRLSLIAANALDPDQLRAAVKNFRRDQPITVVHEGLLPYLSTSEMETVARNIRELLVEFGGVWITPDFSLKADVEQIGDQRQSFRNIVTAATDRKLYNNAFETNEQLLTFFNELGLQAQVFNQVDEAPNIVSLDVLKLSHQIIDRTKPQLKLWVLELAS